MDSSTSSADCDPLSLGDYLVNRMFFVEHVQALVDPLYSCRRSLPTVVERLFGPKRGGLTSAPLVQKLELQANEPSVPLEVHGVREVARPYELLSVPWS